MSSPVPTHVLSPDISRRLENEYGILHLIYHRNYNQHHVAVWWKDINILHRSIRKLLLKHYEFEDARKHLAKHKLHREALAMARAMLKKRIFRRCYYSFNGIVALGQFVALGLALLANLSALHSLISSIDGLDTESESRIVNTARDKSSALSGVQKPAGDDGDDDLGEEVVFVDKANAGKTAANLETPEQVSGTPRPTAKRTLDLDDMESIFGEKPKKKKKEKKEKKPKEKKKKSAMDDIFG